MSCLGHSVSSQQYIPNQEDVGDADTLYAGCTCTYFIQLTIPTTCNTPLMSHTSNKNFNTIREDLDTVPIKNRIPLYASNCTF